MIFHDIPCPIWIHLDPFGSFQCLPRGDHRIDVAIMEARHVHRSLPRNVLPLKLVKVQLEKLDSAWHQHQIWQGVPTETFLPGWHQADRVHEPQGSESQSNMLQLFHIISIHFRQTKNKGATWRLGANFVDYNLIIIPRGAVPSSARTRSSPSSRSLEFPALKTSAAGRTVLLRRGWSPHWPPPTAAVRRWGNPNCQKRNHLSLGKIKHDWSRLKTIGNDWMILDFIGFHMISICLS